MKRQVYLNTFYRSHKRKIAIVLALIFLIDIATPTAAWALTGGPMQPEVSSFEPVSTNQMVDLFSGDFTYNIPLMDVGGYPINIAYHGGVGMEQEASWVGLGWNINPGVINRGVRGIPDDFKGDVITRKMNIKTDKTLSVKAGLGLELAGLKKAIGKNKKGGMTGNLKLGLQFFYNNYKGYYIAPDLGFNMELNSSSKGNVTKGLKFGVNHNAQNGLSVYARPSINIGGSDSKVSASLGVGGATYNARTQSLNLSLVTNLNLNAQTKSMFQTKESRQKRNSQKNSNSKKSKKERKDTRSSLSTIPMTSIPIGQNTYIPNTVPQMQSVFGNVRIAVGPEASSAHPSYYFEGDYNERSLIKNVYHEASYGYLHLQDRPVDDNGYYSGLTDFNRDGNASQFNPNMSYLAPANMTYDVLSVSGQGTGGMYRPFRNDVGVVSDAKFENKGLNGAALGVEIGLGATARFGADATVKNSLDRGSNWIDGQLEPYNFKQNEKESLKENVYYKIAGEIVPVSETFKALGGEDLRTFDLLNNHELTSEGIKINSEVSYSSKNGLSPRQPRGKLITKLDGDEAADMGLDKVIPSYAQSYKAQSDKSAHITSINRVGSQRKSYHTSEITQYEKDGSRYVFGIPALNVSKKEVVFNAEDMSPDSAGLITFKNDVIPDENYTNGRDNFYSSTETPAYAHSYLLTGYLSPDYVDVKGDGITEDDLGNAVKFNWRRSTESMGWRTPLGEDKATFHQGNEADPHDDKASYTYGTKEMWYLQSIESRNYIAIFTMESRNDALSVNEDGTNNTSVTSQKLTKIELFSKEDLKNHPSAPTPIKVVEFKYKDNGDGLCKAAPNNDNKDATGSNLSGGSKGTKLTLEEISFKFGENSSPAFKPYKFHYNTVYKNVDGSDNSDNIYDAGKVDNWGNFKGENLSIVSKEEYPYTNQQVDKAVADSWASLWNLSQIDLPSGGQINITYESDDYAYVQDKRAMEMIQVVGASYDENYNTSNELYSDGGSANKQKYYLIFKLPTYVISGSSSATRLNAMFEEVHNLYYRMKVKVKDGIAEENYVNGYATIDNSDFGICPNNSSYGYVKLASFKGGVMGRRELNPIVANAMTFYDQYMSPLVSPGGDVNTKGNSDWPTISKKFVSIVPDLIQAVIGPVKFMLANGVAQKFNTQKSFIRLVKPDHKKYGGGHRVSQIELNDNWSGATSSRELNNTYGQKYSYTIEENGVEISSGVATYEPLIGADQNPLRQPSTYQLKKNPGTSPNWDLYQETPMGESFYPSASVGYSRVVVRNLHNDKPSSKFYKEHRFYTAKEFPVDFKSTDIQVREPSKWAGKFKPPVGYWHTKNYYTATQGYTFILNDMHGKLWQENHYSEKNAIDSIKLSGKEYIYHGTDPENGNFDMDNVVKAVMRNGNLDDIQLGKELDVTIDSKEIRHQNVSRNVQGSLDLFSIFPLPMVLYLEDKNEIQYRSVVVTKLIQNYGVLSDIIEFDINREVKTSNVLYDGHSGDVLVSEVKNEFGKSIMNSTLPAYWVDDYDRMGHAYRNVGFVGDGGERITILNNCTTANQYHMDYMKHFIYEGLMDSYIGNHDAYDANSASGLTEIFGNLVTKDVFVPGDEVYNSVATNQEDKHLWVINVLDHDQVNLMAYGTNGSNGTICSGTNITGLTNTSIEDKCEEVLSESEFLTQIVGGLPVHTGLTNTTVKGFVDAIINYSNSTGSEATAQDICSYLDDIPSDSRSMKAYKETKNLMDFSYLLSKRYTGFSYQYELNETAALVKFILDRSDLKGVMNLFVEDGTSLTTKERADIFEYIMTQPDLVDYMICQLEYPAVLQFMSKVGCNSEAFDLVRYVLKNEDNEFIESAFTYNPLTYNAESRPVGAGVDLGGNISLGSLFSNTDLPNNYWKYTLNENRTLANLNFEKCHWHQFVDCDYSFDYTSSTTVTPPNASDMNGCCTFDGESFDMTGKDLVIFINRAGNIVDVENNELKIIRSGRRNMITAKVGEISSMEYGPYVDHYKLPAERNKYFTGDKVINASAMEYSEKWVTDRKLDSGTYSINPYVYGIRGNYRPKSGYYINDNRNELGALTIQTPDLSKDGMFTDFTPFWEFAGYMNKLAKSSAASTDWIKSSDITNYSAIYGNPIEEATPLNQDATNVIYSTELIGMHNLASAVANNAKHNEILFEDFEGYNRQKYVRQNNIIYTTANGDPDHISNNTAHTGLYSLRAGIDPNPSSSNSGQLNIDANAVVLQINQNSSIPHHITFSLPLNDQVYDFDKKYFLDDFNPSAGKYIISGWIKDGLNTDYQITSSPRMDASTKNVTYQTTASLTANGINCLSNIQLSPFVEGWQRFQAELTVFSGMTSIDIVFNGGKYGAYLDDLRIYPKDAVMKTYVYHPDVMRLAAQLDENNYATFYDYDFEGNLVRIRKETEKGIMTIQENVKHAVK